MEVVVLGVVGALAVGIPVALWRYWQERARKYQSLFETEQALIQGVAAHNKELKAVIDLQSKKVIELYDQVVDLASDAELLNLLPEPSGDGNGPN